MKENKISERTSKTKWQQSTRTRKYTELIYQQMYCILSEIIGFQDSGILIVITRDRNVVSARFKRHDVAKVMYNFVSTINKFS